MIEFAQLVKRELDKSLDMVNKSSLNNVQKQELRTHLTDIKEAIAEGNETKILETIQQLNDKGNRS